MDFYNTKNRKHKISKIKIFKTKTPKIKVKNHLKKKKFL